jgi:hypothetical protein
MRPFLVVGAAVPKRSSTISSRLETPRTEIAVMRVGLTVESTTSSSERRLGRLWTRRHCHNRSVSSRSGRA